MGSITEAVESHLRMDLALLDTLSRDIASLRRTARWILEEYDLDATEEAVVSALRRYVQRHENSPFTRHPDLLAQTHVDVHTGLILLTLPRSPQAQRRIKQAWETVEPRDYIATWFSHKTFRLLTEDAYLDTLKTIFPPAYRKEITTDIAGIKLQLPTDPEAISLLGHATAALVHEGIPVHDVYTCLPETMLLVSDEDAVNAYDAITHITRKRRNEA